MISAKRIKIVSVKLVEETSIPYKHIEYVALKTNTIFFNNI